MGGQVSNASFAAGQSILNAHKVLAAQTMLYYNGVANNGTDTLHTVTAGKTFYLLAAGIAATALLNLEEFYLYQDGNSHLILQLTSFIPSQIDKWGDSTTITFPLPVPITAGKVIACSADGAGSITRAWIIGWEE